MARITVEDCVLKIPNRFELVMVASQRAREISSGAEITLPRDNDKNTVVSLREIADETVNLSALKEALVRNYQKIVEVEDDDDDVIDIMQGEEEWSAISEQAAESEVELAGLHEDSLDEDAEAVGIESDEDLYK